MIRSLTAGESDGRAFVGIVEGMPAGLSISADYINHQVRRLQKAYRLNAGGKVSLPSVEVLSGMQSGRTLGLPIALVIRNRTRHTPVEAIHVACCTIVRKLLEDLGIFIGSHVICCVGSVAISDRSRTDAMIRRYTRASCGAYKVTEQADTSPVRILDKAYEGRTLALINKEKRVGRSVAGIFELLVTGVPVGLAGGIRIGGSLPELLARALSSVPGVHSIKIRSGFRGAEPFAPEAPGAPAQRGAKGSRRCDRADRLKVGVTDGKLVVVDATTKAMSTSERHLPPAWQGRWKVIKGSTQGPPVFTVPFSSVLAEAVIAPGLANAFLEKFHGSTVAEIRSRYRKSSD